MFMVYVDALVAKPLSSESNYGVTTRGIFITF